MQKIKGVKNSMIGWLLFILAFFLLGKKVNKKKTLIIQDKEARKLFKKAFPKLIFLYIADYKYKIPTKEALGNFLQWWIKWIAKEKIKYIVDYFDCDNFALLFTAMALRKGLHIPITNSEIHSYNASIVLSGDKKEIIIIEPQTGEVFSPQKAQEDKKYQTIFLYYT